jgi:hypothetical protein
MSAALWVGGLPAELQWIYSTAADKAARDPITLAENRSIRGLSVFMVEGGSDPFLPADRHLYRELKHRGLRAWRCHFNPIGIRSHRVVCHHFKTDLLCPELERLLLVLDIYGDGCNGLNHESFTPALFFSDLQNNDEPR